MDACDNREPFIPYRRTDIINLCLNDGRLNRKEANLFQDFCQILSAFYHFRFHTSLERIKDNYVVFNPHSEIKLLDRPSLDRYDRMSDRLIESFEQILIRANYLKLPEAILEKALKQNSLIDLKTEVNFQDFDRLLCYYRGDTTRTISQKKLFFWRQKKKIEFLV